MVERIVHIAPFDVILHPRVYEPAEDTYLLLDNLPELAGETFLELGAGTGVISLFAAKSARRVVSTDINPHAVELIKRNIEKNKKHLNTIPQVRLGDLFSPIKKTEKFDVIAFNPPYLPKDQEDTYSRKSPSDLWLRSSWEGGERGIEITSSFLNQVGDHLHSDGRVYLIISSISGVGSVISQANLNNLELTISTSIKFPFETLSLLIGGKKK